MPGEVELHVEAGPDGTLAPMRLDPGKAYRVVVSFVPIFRTEPATLRFDTSSCVLAPLVPGAVPWPALATAAAKRQTENGAIVILGHASTTGPHALNQALAQRRANTTSALLRQDENGWLDLVSEHGSPADIQRWLQTWSQTHGWATDPGRTDGVLDNSAVTAIRAFQSTYNSAFNGDIEEDGRLTRATLAAVFRVFMSELDSNFRAHGIERGSVQVESDHAIGCGVDFADFAPADRMPESGNPDGQRRVDVLVLPRRCQWQPTLGPKALILYTKPIALPVSADAPKPREVRIRLVDHYGSPMANEQYHVAVGNVGRTGTTDAQGELIESDIPDGTLVLRLTDSSPVVFDEAYRQASVERSRINSDAQSEATLDDFADFDLPAPDGDINADLREFDLALEEDDDDA